jgi:hypothetical protein
MFPPWQECLPIYDAADNRFPACVFMHIHSDCYFVYDTRQGLYNTGSYDLWMPTVETFKCSRVWLWSTVHPLIMRWTNLFSKNRQNDGQHHVSYKWLKYANLLIDRNCRVNKQRVISRREGSVWIWNGGRRADSDGLTARYPSITFCWMTCGRTG